MKDTLDKLVQNGWLIGYNIQDDDTLIIRYALSSVKDTQRVVFVEDNDLKSALLKSANDLETDIKDSLVAEDDYFGYDTQEELEERIQEETEYLRNLSEEV